MEGLRWLIWLPQALTGVILLVIIANASTGGSVDNLDGTKLSALILFVGGTLWYTAFLIVLYLSSLGARLTEPLARGGVAAALTVVLVLALGATPSEGGFLSFNLRDIFVTVPGMLLIKLADSLPVSTLLPDRRRCDPHTWRERQLNRESRDIYDAELAPDGRVLLEVGVRLDRGVFPDRRERTVVALFATGELDEGFTRRLGSCVEGNPWFTDAGILLHDGARVSGWVSFEGTRASAAVLERFTAALTAFGPATLVRAGPRHLVATRRLPTAEIAVFDIHDSGVSLAARFALGGDPLPGGWAAALAGGALYIADTHMSPLLGDAGEPPVSVLLRRYSSAGPDPAFTLTLPADLSAHIGRKRLELRHLLAVGDRLLVDFHWGEDLLTFVRADGSFDTRLRVETRFGHLDNDDGYISSLHLLADGRLAVVFSPSDASRPQRVTILIPAGAHELRALSGRDTKNERAQSVEVTTSGGGDRLDLLVKAGEVLAVNSGGVLLIRDHRTRELRLYDIDRRAFLPFRGPPWLEVESRVF